MLRLLLTTTAATIALAPGVAGGVEAPDLGSVWVAPTSLVSSPEELCLDLGLQGAMVAGRGQYRFRAVGSTEAPTPTVALVTTCGAWRPVPGLALFAAGGFYRHVEGQTADGVSTFLDPGVGAQFAHTVSGDGFAGARGGLVFRHWLTVSLPASRGSRQNELYMAPQLASEVRFNLVDNLVVGAAARFQYRWYKYSELPGLEGSYNTQLVADGAALAEYTLVLPGDVGWLTLGAVGRTVWAKKYVGADLYSSPYASARSPWGHAFAWGVAFAWSPVRYVTLEVELQKPPSISGQLPSEFRSVGGGEVSEMQVSATGRF